TAAIAGSMRSASRAAVRCLIAAFLTRVLAVAGIARPVMFSVGTKTKSAPSGMKDQTIIAILHVRLKYRMAAAWRQAGRGHLRGLAQAGQKRVDALEQQRGVLAELAGRDQHVLRKIARLARGLARTDDILGHLAGADGRLLHAACD